MKDSTMMMVAYSTIFAKNIIEPFLIKYPLAYNELEYAKLQVDKK